MLDKGCPIPTSVAASRRRRRAHTQITEPMGVTWRAMVNTIETTAEELCDYAYHITVRARIDRSRGGCGP